MNNKQYVSIYCAWVIALVSVATSIFFSYILQLPPCSLCWYQRIAIFPLIIIFCVGLYKRDHNVGLYAIPLIVIGWFISLYHNLIYYNLVAKPISMCSAGASCSERQLDFLGFISIPLMALLSLSLMLFFVLKFFVNKQEGVK